MIVFRGNESQRFRLHFSSLYVSIGSIFIELYFFKVNKIHIKMFQIKITYLKQFFTIIVFRGNESQHFKLHFDSLYVSIESISIELCLFKINKMHIKTFQMEITYSKTIFNYKNIY